mgnify:CR=1 FL=1
MQMWFFKLESHFYTFSIPLYERKQNKNKKNVLREGGRGGREVERKQIESYTHTHKKERVRVCSVVSMGGGGGGSSEDYVYCKRN